MIPKIVPKNKIPKIASTTSSIRLRGYYLVPQINPTIKYRLETFVTIIGRDAGCNIVLEDTAVSARHCLIEVMPQALRIRDLKSTNGTFLNGIPVQEEFMQPSDIFVLGTFAFTVFNEEESCAS